MANLTPSNTLWSRRRLFYDGARIAIGASLAAVPSLVQAYATWQYLPPTWNIGWNAALTNAVTTPCWIAVIGDSIAQGLVATNFMTSSWFALLRWMLLQHSPLFADFYTPAHSGAYIRTTGISYHQQLPWSFRPSIPVKFTVQGYGRVPMLEGTVLRTFATYTSPYPCSGLDIIWANRFGVADATWSFAIDSATPQTVTTPPLGIYPYRLSIYGLEPQRSHTIAFSNQSATAAWNVWGVASYSGHSGGIGFALLASAGDSVQTWNPSKQEPLGREFLLAGPSYIGNTGFGFPVGPNLAIIALSANDALLGTPIQAYRDGLIAFIQAVRLNLPTASIALLAMNIPTTDLDLASPFQGIASHYPPYLGAMQTVARRYNCAFLNFHAKWGPNSIANGLVTSNGHPTDLGHQDIATSLYNALGTPR